MVTLVKQLLKPLQVLTLAGNDFISDPPDGSSPGFLSSGIFTTAERGSTGDSGQLRLVTPRLTLREGGKISAGTAGSGNEGTINLHAGEISVSDPVIDGNGVVSGIVADVAATGTGSSGALNIVTECH
ncbi:MAG: hypothetical protein AAFQ40_02710 [Cyanobacteria bacterium J06623_5]